MLYQLVTCTYVAGDSMIQKQSATRETGDVKRQTSYTNKNQPQRGRNVGGLSRSGGVGHALGAGGSHFGGFIQEQGEMQDERGGGVGGGVSRSGDRETSYTMAEQGERRHIKRARHAETGTGTPPTQEGTGVSKDGGGRGGVLGAYSSSKEAYSSTKEAYSSTKEAYSSTKEAYSSSKEAHSSTNEAYCSTKETTCRRSKEAYNSSTETSSTSRETNSSRAAENSSRLFESTYAAYAILSQFHSTSPGPT
jgi:hypothetical protein